MSTEETKAKLTATAKMRQLQLDLEDAVHHLDKLKSEHYQLELDHKALQQKHKRTVSELEQRKILGA